MKEATEFIERLLWFIYRVLFTVIPGVFMFLICYIFLYYTNSNLPEQINDLLDEIRPVKWLALFSIIFCMSTLLEAIANVIFKTLDFKGITRNKYGNDKILIKLLETNNKDLLEVSKSQEDDEKINLNETLFNFGLLTGNQQSNWFNNYIWFLISREYIFTNLAVALSAGAFVFFPYFLYYEYHLNFKIFYLFQVIQLGFLILIFLTIPSLLKIHYPAKPKDGYSGPLKTITNSFLFIPLILMALAIPMLTKAFLLPYGIFICFNAFLAFICPLIILRALREFVHVEYMILVSFAKDRYYKEDKNGHVNDNEKDKNLHSK